MLLKPLHPHRLLSWMAIGESYPGAYILGSFARHVTIYSQQMRAFNLIDALCKTGQLTNGVRVAVVGGGIAGLTAAAAAAVRGAAVTVVEMKPVFFPIQRNASDRYLHPHIYDWPLNELAEGLEDLTKADFPVLGWDAGEAKSVFQSLEDSWNEFCQTYKGEHPPESLMGTEFIGLARNPKDNCLELTVRKDRPDTETTLTAQIVILALGFGRETERPDILKYWDSSPLDSILAKPLSRWLISGYGDGGLTDLMRLRIKDFRHDQFVQKFANDSELIRKLKELLTRQQSKTVSVRATFEGLYQQLDAPLLKADDLRTDTNVTFNAPENYLEHEGSSILNRFIVFLLEKLDTNLERQGGWVKLPIPDAVDYEYNIEFTDEHHNVIHTDVFDRLVIRHGPAPAVGEKQLSAIWEAAQELRAKWAGQSQSSDQSRVQIWDSADYDPANAPNPIMDEDEPNDDADLRCVILESTNQRKNSRLNALAKSAIMSVRGELKLRLGRKQDEEDLRLTFDTLQINHALSSQKAYNKAVRALCRADIVIIDVTAYEPGVMLFLGIRAAVRRGVTVVTTNDQLTAAAWSALPFNLKELYPLSVYQQTSDIGSEEHPIRRLGTTIARAFDQYHSFSFYQDLPAYETVRRLESTPTQEPQSILWLCPFNEKYSPCENYIQQGFATVYGGEKTRDGRRIYKLERIIEIISPQLVTQRLYSAIRRTGMCLVDWTLWSPNVFFEFGVRLAVSSMGPVCLVEKGLLDVTEGAEKKDSAGADAPPSEELIEQRQALRKLFNPIVYGRESEEQKLFEEIRQRYADMQEYEAPTGARGMAPTFGAFAYNHTYKLVGEYLPLGQEPGASAAHEFLKASASALVGVSPKSDQNIPVLFANVNNDLDKQARAAAKELLIAAWYYLGNRYADELKREGDLLEYYTDLGYLLLDLLEQSGDPKDIELFNSVDNILIRLEHDGPEEVGNE